MTNKISIDENGNKWIARYVIVEFPSKKETEVSEKVFDLFVKAMK